MNNDWILYMILAIVIVVAAPVFVFIAFIWLIYKVCEIAFKDTRKGL